MKKRNKSLSKRLLASSLALAMCASMVCTTAFADEAHDDYVYVYINVTEGSVETGSETPAPTFKDFVEGNKDAVKEATDAIKTAEDNMSSAESTVTQTGSKVTEAKETVDGAKVDPDTKPEFDKDGSLAGAVEGAKDGVLDALGALDAAKPEFSENADSDQPSLIDGEQGGETGTEKTFVETVTDKIAELEAAKGTTETKVDNAQDSAESAQRDLIALSNAATEAKSALKGAQDKALEAANAANKAAEEAQEACDAEKDRLQAELDQKLADLPTPPAAAPAVESFDTYEEYTAAYEAWDSDRVAYNTAVNTLKGAYDTAVADLDAKVKEEQAKVDAAKLELENAKKALDALDKAFDGANSTAVSEEMGAYSDLIKAYNDALQKYNDAVTGTGEGEDHVDGYNDKVDGYTGAKDAYNGAVDAYNNAADAHDKAAGEYNGKLENYNNAVDGYTQTVTDYENAVTEYDKKVTTYEESVDAYNTNVVDKYNTNVAEQHNTTQIADAESTVKGKTSEAAKQLQNALNALDTKIDIKDADGNVVKSVDSNTSAWAELTDEEYNQAVGAYNAKVEAYNKAVDKYNGQATKDLIAEVGKYFPGQGSYGESEDQGGTKNAWFTVGKIKVEDIFKTSPESIRNQYLNDGQYDHAVDKNATNKDVTQGRDLYYWDRNSDGSYTVNMKESVADKEENGTLANIYGSKPNSREKYDREDLENALSNTQNFDRYTVRGAGQPTGTFDPKEDVTRWVLKASSGGAKDYVSSGSAATWHLDGYLYADTLSKLATLEERTIAKTTTDYSETVNEYKETSQTLQNKKFNLDDSDPNNDKAKTAPTLSDGRLEVSGPSKYSEYGSVIKPNASTQDKTEWTEPDAIPFEPGELEDKTPNTIPEGTLAPEPDDEGGGTGGGGDGGTPPVIIEDPDVPLAETPEIEEPVVEIPDEEVPLAEIPEEVVIPDEDVPLAEVPKTGDISAMWYTMTMASACGLAALALRRKENA